MTDEQAGMAPEAAPSQEAGTEDASRTAEEVDAEWQSRHTALGRQHAAEVATLKNQIAALSGEKAEVTQQAEGTLTEAEALKRQLAEMQNANKQQAYDFATRIRTAQYPFAAEALDPDVLASMDEAKLAGLNARLTPSRSGVGIDPSTPARTPEAQKPLDQKTTEELKADLRRFGPQFAEEIANR